ncbi:MAG: hypothetical protein EOO27_15230 [Comamonadaceae bacterium]|nr:MAG: hypothetical protein EOO27_15230 [Comamonadaceae bacterium]
MEPATRPSPAPTAPQEAENMRLRSTLLIALSQRIEPPARWCLLRRSGQWRHLLSRGSSASWATAAQPLRSMTAAAGAAGVAAVHLIAPAPLCGFPDGYNAVPVTDNQLYSTYWMRAGRA